MSTFKISCNRCSNSMEEFQAIAKTLHEYEKCVSQISSNISISGISGITLKTALNTSANNIGLCCTSLNNLSSIGLEVVSLYKLCENSILNAQIADFGASSIENKSNNAGTDVFGEKNSYIYRNENNQKLVFHEGEAKQPEWEPYKQYDMDFTYNPNAKASFSDYANWLKWGTFLNGGTVLDSDELQDALKCYAHYRYGNGEDLEIDYEKAYREDAAIRSAVDGYVYDTQLAVEEMIRQGKRPPFQITSELMPVGNPHYPQTENWQKTIGAHQVWISADVSVNDNGEIVMNTTIHEIDRYNFNAGAQDIATGAKDYENGRFEELGWAKSFNTKGSMNMNVTWRPGEAVEKPTVTSKGRGSGRENVRNQRTN